MTTAITQQRVDWLRGPRFDTVFIVGIAGLALCSGLLVAARPDLFLLVLLLDLWLLGYHHVIATFSRFLSDRATIREHVDLLTWWPLAIAGLVVTAGFGIGLWTLTTTYLYWQWFHYTRQSWGISRAYERKSGLHHEPTTLAKITFYAVPAWGILYLSHHQPDQLLSAELRTLPVPGFVVQVTGIIALGLVLRWALTSLREFHDRRLRRAHTLMVSSHFVVFSAGYVVVPLIGASFDAGWLVLNVWHNAQYIAFVWHFNNRQAEKADSPNFFARLSQNGKVGRYLLISVLTSTLIYLIIGTTIALAVSPIIVYQVINFHHYVVDSKIWKMRRPAVREPLGLS